ncbi:MAG TPA: hypothetical protein VHV83_14650, partial [Armatimonadota bacterium]|nr:hypothetical protein [Armatimonadota bacterium]
MYGGRLTARFSGHMLLVFSVTVLLGLCSLMPSQAQRRNQYLGTYIATAQYGALLVNNVLLVNADGTTRLTTTISSAGRQQTVVQTGQWQVRNNRLVLTLTRIEGQPISYAQVF